MSTATLNKERVLQVAAAVRAGALASRGLGFNMCHVIQLRAEPTVLAYDDKTGHGCGTVGCIAGWVLALAHPEESVRELFDRSTFEAGEWLGLPNWEDSDPLFFARDAQVGMDRITPEQAARCLELLAETGEVRWDEATKETADDK